MSLPNETISTSRKSCNFAYKASFLDSFSIFFFLDENMIYRYVVSLDKNFELIDALDLDLKLQLLNCNFFAMY